MRFVAPLTFVTAASAVVIKDRLTSLKDKIQHDADSILADVHDAVDSRIDSVAESISSGVNEVRDAQQRIEAELSNGFRELFGQNRDESGLEDIHVKGGHDLSNYTIWELISQANETQKFYEIASRYEDIVKLLNDTDKEYTLFVPTDKAFENLPKHKKPSDEAIANAIRYHIGRGSYPAGKILSTHTIPTEYDEKSLGGKPQRLRTSVGLNGVRVNVYSKVIAADFKAKNGIIHAVNHVLVPPTSIGREIGFFPSEFSTLLLAYEKTDLVKYLHTLKIVGSTVFAPSNKAWEKLGPAANAYLFNTESGKKHLAALLKYQIVPNTTVYTDEIYYGDEGSKERMAESLSKIGHFHIQLPTLLKKDISVDIYNWKLWTSIVVNGAVNVGFTDGIGKNGVIQVVEDIPVPHGKAGDRQESWHNIEVEELKRRLDELIESEEENEEAPGEL